MVITSNDYNAGAAVAKISSINGIILVELSKSISGFKMEVDIIAQKCLQSFQYRLFF